MAREDPTIDWQRIAMTQDGVIGRQQLLDAGLADHDIKRLIRRRDLATAHRGVFLTHTGRPSWQERAWAAVIACWPAALGSRTALPNPPPDAAITVVIPRERTVVPPPGVHVLRRTSFGAELSAHSYPPRQRPAYAALDAVVDLSESEAYALLAGLAQRRTVTTDDLRAALATRERIPRRRLLTDLLTDLETGSLSVLERAYLRRVERAHGLPRGQRQAADEIEGRRGQRDVLYSVFGLVVELDGRAFHDNAASRDADGARDLLAAAHRDLRTVRVTTGQALSGACDTARLIGAVLNRGGWQGTAQRCPECATSKVSAG